MAPPKGANPSKWKYKDPDVHKKYIPFLRARAQAWYRGELWELSFEEYQEFWTEDAWQQKGRNKHSLLMRLRDPKIKVWSKDNVELTTRSLHLREKRQSERGQPRPRRKKILIAQ